MISIFKMSKDEVTDEEMQIKILNTVKSTRKEKANPYTNTRLNEAFEIVEPQLEIFSTRTITGFNAWFSDIKYIFSILRGLAESIAESQETGKAIGLTKNEIYRINIMRASNIWMTSKQHKIIMGIGENTGFTCLFDGNDRFESRLYRKSIRGGNLDITSKNQIEVANNIFSDIEMTCNKITMANASDLSDVKYTAMLFTCIASILCLITVTAVVATETPLGFLSIEIMSVIYMVLSTITKSIG